MGLSHSELKGWYRYFNRKWFDSRLPADMDVMYAPDDRTHGLAIRERTDERVIMIDTTLAGTRYAKMTLLHEMVHHDTGDFRHGKRFQGGMLRLAARGAFRNIW
jgi:hypothetical protein